MIHSPTYYNLSKISISYFISFDYKKNKIISTGNDFSPVSLILFPIFSSFFILFMFALNGFTNDANYDFRPVVTLNSNVQLEPDGTNTWKIK